MKKNPPIRQYSIAEARDHLARVIHDVERGSRVELTRRGKLVAVLVAAPEYARLTQGAASFSKAFEQFAKRVDLEELDIPPSFFEKLRDRSPGRDVHL